LSLIRGRYTGVVLLPEAIEKLLHRGMSTAQSSGRGKKKRRELRKNTVTHMSMVVRNYRREGG